MTGRDPGHAGGAQVYRPPAPPCRCDHLDGVHSLTKSGRGTCSAWCCTCTRYQPELAPPGRAAELDRGRAEPSKRMDPT